MAYSFDNLLSQKEVDDRKAALIQEQEQAYQDQLAQIAANEQLYRDQVNTSKQNVNTSLASTIDQANRDALRQTTMQRQNYGDLVTQGRQRARAFGGSAQSGVLEMYNKLDQNLQNNLYQIGSAKGSAIDQANTTAQQALGQLEQQLNQYIAQINADRTTSLREKDSAIREIEYQALAQANAIKQWLASQSGGSGGSYYGGYPTGGDPTTTGADGELVVDDGTGEAGVANYNYATSGDKNLEQAAAFDITSAASRGDQNAMYEKLNYWQERIGRNNPLIVDLWKQWDYLRKNPKPATNYKDYIMM